MRHWKPEKKESAKAESFLLPIKEALEKRTRSSSSTNKKSARCVYGFHQSFMFFNSEMPLFNTFHR